MRGLRAFIIIALVIGGLFYYMQNNLQTENAFSNVEDNVLPKELSIDIKALPVKKTVISGLNGELYNWIGKDTSFLVEELGEPVRKDLSSYNYVWWIYTDRAEKVIQFGVEDNQVVTIYATGSELDTEPIEIGQSYETVNELLDFQEEISFNKGLQSYRFLLTAEDLSMRPAVQISDDVFIQCYFDTFTEKLSSIRLVSADVLLLQRPYEIFYRGDLPETPILSEQEWDTIQVGMEQQIYDITNIIRHRFNEPSLDWDQEVAEVAFMHSKDMEENNYFSHYTLDGEGLKERLTTDEIYYLAAGENIAAQYTDGPAAVEGWLNSEGHREALLKGEYTHLGVGVYRYYYTQNFLQKP
ncbi:CAP domain-containing protein [Radiobacillus sp. PE A8.2]|uniref:CAP domain-containing protein n=1 Tax=Radiobacillus sp. PE A8.2 TaxID=3380349 RepID=UPI00388CF06A